ncbi:MAG TPA: transcription-repair coupling factor [Gaiellaceae bacterium]
MDRPVLHAFVRELAGHERLASLAAALPTRARVSEPALPLFVSALHERLERGLTVLVADDEDARNLAEAAGWFLGEDAVAFLPSRGVRWDSGLLPAAHLVGERARALEVLAGGGLIFISAAALAEGMPPLELRLDSIRLRAGDRKSLEEVSSDLAGAGYERVERAEERGQFAVRGGLVDVFPASGRDPLRIEFFGDEIEQMRAFSPFTQRTLHEVEQVLVQPTAEWRIDLAASLEEEEGAPELPAPLVSPLESAPDLVWQREEVERVWREELDIDPLPLEGVGELDPFPRGQSFSFEAQRPAFAARGLSEAERDLGSLVRSGQRVVVTFPHRGEALRTGSRLRSLAAPLIEPGEELAREGDLRFAVSSARRGLVWRELGLVLLPSSQIFRKRPSRAAPRIGRALQSFSDLRPGDYVVHEDQGVGKLLAFETKKVAGVTRDYLLLAFKGDDRLYVPHEQIGKVSRYIGSDGKAPALSKLDGKAWQLLKSRARVNVHELAGELLSLYAQRQQVEGVAYDLDQPWLEQLEAGFPFRETEDQARAIEAVKEDLEAPRPMDRLVCGDVGFGKTEIAVRAAFAVTLNGRQALVLAPTTVLAEQHWNTFRERYRDFPVRVEMVSRFRRPAETKRILADFREGKIDVLIGTHRVLSRDVIAKDLGLVVLDEEQRFGVAQKDLLRSLRLEVDVLTLSATPIPRTLHMSLAGLRDISTIETPPEGRQPIRTYVGAYDEELIKSALEREHARGGQSFYLHNRVETIEETAEHLRQLCPGLNMVVAHGKMRERQLEEQVLSFLHGEADVLVSTTIIESGLDIPRANTLVIERADALGLAQLYQIRGRVGRSDRIAHAYLLYPNAEELSHEARMRLATLADHTELGAGLAIAMRDLELRGAGSLLGDEQSGHVAAVGFELYVEMLEEAVAELSGRRHATPRPLRVDARIDAYIPAGYVSSEALKIDLHRRLALVEDEDELRELESSCQDRFGPLPEPVANLFAIQRAKLGLAQIGADYLVYRDGRVSVGPLVLGSGELRELKTRVDTAVYSSSKRELTLRGSTFAAANDLLVAILAARRA